jgi:hypothetical protein
MCEKNAFFNIIIFYIIFTLTYPRNELVLVYSEIVIFFHYHWSFFFLHCIYFFNLSGKYSKRSIMVPMQLNFFVQIFNK